MMRRAVCSVVVMVMCGTAVADVVQHVSGQIAGWRGGWNPTWHARLELWPEPAAGVTFAEFDQAAVQAEIDAVVATYGSWDAKIIVTQVDWVDDAIPATLQPVVGAVDIDTSTLSWSSAQAYSAGSGSWRYDGVNYASFAEVVLASAAAGDSSLFEASDAQWTAEWKPVGQEPASSQDYWDIIIDVPEPLITHYVGHAGSDGLFVGARMNDGSVTVFGNDQWGGSADIRIRIDPPPADAPWIVADPEALSFMIALTDPVSDPQSVTVTNAGGGTLAWTAAESPDASWLTLTDTTGGDGDACTAVVDASGLTPGTYIALVAVTDPAAANRADVVVGLEVFASQSPQIALDPGSVAVGLRPDQAPPAAIPIVVNNTAFGTLNWTATISGTPPTWLSLSSTAGSDGDAFNLHIDHAGMPRGAHAATVEVSDPSASNSPQVLTVDLEIFDQDADIDIACSYDDGWEEGPSGWVAYCRNLYNIKDPGQRTPGFVVRLGDSITYANPGGQWAAYGAGRTPEDLATCNWMHAADTWPDPIHNDSANGWYLSRVDVPGRGGSYTARSSITSAGMLTGWGGLPSADQMFTDGFTNPDGKQYTDAEIVVLLLGSNDVSSRPTADFIADVEAIVDRILANDTIVVLTTPPPRRGREAQVEAYCDAVSSLAATKSLPLIDLHEEIMRRRPGDSWDGTLMASDGLHPSASYGAYGATSDPYADNGAALSHSGYLLWCWLTVQKIKEIKAKCIDEEVEAEWLDPTDPDVDVVLNTEDTGLAFYGGPRNPVEWLINRGGSSSVRIKSYDDPALIKWDLTEYAGQTILDAELHVCRSNPSTDFFALAAATINADWAEGTSGTAVDGNPCWRWRSYDAADPSASEEWTFTGSDFTTASYGNFGSLSSLSCKASGTFKTYVDGSRTWIAMKLDPALVHAMVLDQYGLVVTDGRGRAYVNPSIYTKEQGSAYQPRLYLKAAVDDTTEPGDVSLLDAAAGDLPGEVLLSFVAPLDVDDGRAFGYEMRFATHTDFATATPAARWRIPRPASPGETQRMMLEGLTPGQNYTFFVRAYDKVGNTSAIASTTFTMPAPTTPVLADAGWVDPDPTGLDLRGVPGVLNYWACSSLAKVNPANGNRLADGYGDPVNDAYRKANAVWHAGDNIVRVHAARNEVVAFQLILQRLTAGLTDVSVTVDDLTGPASATISAVDCVELFKLHYVESGGSYYGDPAIPLASPFATTCDIPSVNNPSGVCQSIWADIYVPRDSVAGTYSSTITIDCAELAEPASVGLLVVVHDATIPDEQTFSVDLNGYGNKWDSEASRFQVFQLCQKHRMVPNTLPYGWSGGVDSDRAPALSGSGPTTTISDVTEFADRYGPFLDGSAFSPTHPTYPYIGPGAHTPIAKFYTAFHEGWPVSLTDSTWGFDAAGAGWSYWNTLVDAGDTTAWHEMPDAFDAFPSGYATGYRNVAQQFAQYAQDHGWHGTAFQMYLNNKFSYNPCIALWTLEEQYVADDFHTNAYFLDLCKQGVEAADAPNVQWDWRIDTSTRWGQNWGQLRDICNMRVVGGDIEWYYRHIRFRQVLERTTEQWWWYGTGPGASDGLTDHPADFLRQWSHGLTGGVPYWDNYHTNWSSADALAVVPSGDDVPGHGTFDGRLATVRMKGMRFGIQLIECLNLLAGRAGWNHSRVAQALSNRYGDQTGDAYDPWGGDAYDGMTILDYHRLRADLFASLEGTFAPADFNEDGSVDLLDYAIFYGTLSGPDVPVDSPADLDHDGDVDMADFAQFVMAFGQ